MKFELPRGTRDLESEEYGMIEFTKQKFLETSELFGFKIMEPSPLEMLSTLEAKSGPSIGNEIYSFRDKGGRDIALRFDLTVGLTRYVAARRDLRLPVKLSSFGNVWRYDEPQMGRYRWFHQWDVEIYDSFSVESDAEVIEFTKAYLDAIQLKDTVIEVCDRELLEDYIRNKLGIGDDHALMEMLRVVDKVPKKGEKAVVEEYSGKGFDAEKLHELIELSTVKGDADAVAGDERVKGLSKISKITALMDSLKSRGVRNARINMGIVRGLDYYSGIVFEVFDKSGDLGALVGGGRYDTLTAAFGRSDIGATGAAGGIERLVSALLKHGYASAAGRRGAEQRIFVAYAQDNLRERAINLTSSLRSNGVPAEFDIAGRSLKKQLEETSKRGYNFAAILAPEELARNELILRDMGKGTEIRMKMDDLLKDPRSVLQNLA
ncbi:MAG: histidine--tRNA ligase [Nitrososphaerales archaeon]